MKEARGGGSWRVFREGGGGGGEEVGAGPVGGAGWSMVDAPRSSIKSIPRSEKRQSVAGASLPSVVLDHVSQLDDELSLLVLLTALKRVLLFKNTQKGEETYVTRTTLAHVHAGA